MRVFKQNRWKKFRESGLIANVSSWRFRLTQYDSITQWRRQLWEFTRSRQVNNMSEIVQDRDIVVIEDYRKSRMAYRMARLPMTLSEVEGHFWCFRHLWYP